MKDYDEDEEYSFHELESALLGEDNCYSGGNGTRDISGKLNLSNRYFV
jgi:hypothetical protein